MEIKILFGSETGNSEGLAIGAKKDLQNVGYKAEVIDMADVSVKDLETFENVLFITSTWGDGEPPSNAIELHRDLSSSSINLHNLNYAVFAIGESFYDQFCKAGEDFDEYLMKLGGKRILPLEKSDADFDEKFPKWMDNLKKQLSI